MTLPAESRNSPQTPGRPLRQAFYDRDVVTVARDLIGCVLRRPTAGGPVLAGRIVETEAYQHDDPASHAYSGQSARNASMFGPAGHAYVYLIYGMYNCFNVVCGPPGTADAVLIRAIEPTSGLSVMWQNRFGVEMPEPDVRLTASRRELPALSSGPGKLCLALGITRSDIDGSSLESGPVTIHAASSPAGPIVATPRIGISKALENEWRFLESGNSFVSRGASQNSSRGKRRESQSPDQGPR